VGFELTIPASERAKIVHALNRAAIVMGNKAMFSEILMIGYFGLRNLNFILVGKKV
jgi:hypothetical protein